MADTGPPSSVTPPPTRSWECQVLHTQAWGGLAFLPAASRGSVAGSSRLFCVPEDRSGRLFKMHTQGPATVFRFRRLGARAPESEFGSSGRLRPHLERNRCMLTCSHSSAVMEKSRSRNRRLRSRAEIPVSLGCPGDEYGPSLPTPLGLRVSFQSAVGTRGGRAKGLNFPPVLRLFPDVQLLWGKRGGGRRQGGRGAGIRGQGKREPGLADRPRCANYVCVYCPRCVGWLAQALESDGSVF